MSEEEKKAGATWGDLGIAFMENFFAPTIASQKTKANIIASEAEQDLAERALKRQAAKAIREEANLEAILQKTGEELAEKGMSPDIGVEKLRQIDNDFSARFIQCAEITADEEMQSLWAKILAGEATQSGKFSKRTISLVNDMEVKDAKMFTDFCRFVWVSRYGMINTINPLIYSWKDKIYTLEKYSLNIFEIMKHLDAIGLVSYSGSGYGEQYNESKPIWSYGNTDVFLNLPQDKDKKYSMDKGMALFTEAGEQLYSICGAEMNEEFFQYVFNLWKEKGYNPSLTPHP